jgi:hypothetical protein
MRGPLHKRTHPLLVGGSESGRRFSNTKCPAGAGLNYLPAAADYT